MNFLLWIGRFARDFPRQFLAVCLSLLILSAGGAWAATSYDVANEPQMYLDTSINTTSTTITLSSPQVNGANHLFTTTSGAVMRIRSGFFREDIYVPSATVGSNNKVTLNSVTRNLCPYTGHQFVSCGAGRTWGKGAIVELTVDKNLLNAKANKDRPNVFTASGALGFTGSGSNSFPIFATTALRDHNLGTGAMPGLQACVTGTGLCYYTLSGTWNTYGNTGVGNATETTSGVAEAAVIADQLSRASLGDSGAPLFLQPKHLTTSGGTLANGRIPLLSGGVLDESLTGTSVTSGAYLRANNYGPPKWTTLSFNNSTNLVNSGSLTINSFMTGALLNAQQTSTPFFTVQGPVKNGHITTGGTGPTFAPECSITANVGNDTAGRFQVTGGTETRCSLYFNKRFTKIPSCTISHNLPLVAPPIVVTTNTGFILKVSGAGDDLNSYVISYLCLEYY